MSVPVRNAASAFPLSDTGGIVRSNSVTADGQLSGQKRPPVAMRGRMTLAGYQPENVDHIDVLTVRDEHGQRVGLDPMEIDPSTLTAAGHPPLETRRILGAMGDVPIVEGMKEYRDLRRQCVESCAENIAEVRRCAIINCPIWPFRMGRNPHNPQRGVNPFERSDGAT